MNKHKVSIAAAFLWIGFVCGISFMEAWLKFQAPGISVSLGLGIGRLVFGALNKVEWCLAFIIMLNILIAKRSLLKIENVAYFVPLILLLLQTFWLLPALDKRAEMRISGTAPPASAVHIYYVAMEVSKVLCLSIFGSALFSKYKLK